MYAQMVQSSHTFKHDLNPFLSFVFHNDRLQNHRWLSVKSMTSNFVVVVSALLPIFVILAGVCHICAFLSKKLSRYLVRLLTNGCKHLSSVRIRA